MYLGRVIIAHVTMQVYVSAMVNIEGGVGNIVNRSMIASIVSKQELGTVYGLLAILDAVLPFIGEIKGGIFIHFMKHYSSVCPASTLLYQTFQHSLPSAFCFFNALILLSGGFVLLTIYTIVVKHNCQVIAK